MDWITDDVAIGNHREAQDRSCVLASGFRSALSLDGTLEEARAKDLGLAEVVVVRLIDGPGNEFRLFRLAVDSLSRLADSRAPVLVQCHAGRSRSAAVVAGYLIVSRGLEVEQALGMVGERRDVNVSPPFLSLLSRL